MPTKPYPALAPVFRDRHGVAGEGRPSLLEGHIIVNRSEHNIEEVEPLTVSAVVMYEQAGGTLETARKAAGHRRGPRPDKVFTRAKIYKQTGITRI